MPTIIIIDLLVVAVLCGIAFSKGLERALPFATFVVVFLPIESRFDVGFFALTTHRLVFIVLLLLCIFPGGSKSRTDSRFTTPLKILIAIHIVWCLISTANSIEPLASVKKLFSVLFEYYVLYFVYSKTVTQIETVKKILMAMVGAVVSSSVFGAIEAYRGWSVLNLLPQLQHRFGAGGLDIEAGERGLRIQSTFGHPILFGAALAMGILLALFLVTIVQKRWQKVFLFTGLMLMFLNIYKTSSRGPWLDAMLGCALLFIGGGRQVRKLLLVMGALSLAVLIIRPGVWGTIEGIYENTFNDNTSQGTSYEYRYALPKVATAALSRDFSRQLWGYGLETFYDLHLQGELAGAPYTFLSCDDSWVELMVETGYIGLAIIALLLLRPAFLAWRDFRRIPEPDRQFSFLFFVNMVIFYFQMLSVGMYSWGQNGYMLWIVIALSVSFNRVRQNESEAPVNEPAPAFASPVASPVGVASRAV